MKLARNAFVVAGLLLAVACGSSTKPAGLRRPRVPTFQGLSAEVSNTASEDAASPPTGRAGPGSERQRGVAAQDPGRHPTASTRDLKDCLPPGGAAGPHRRSEPDPGPDQHLRPFDKDGFSYLLLVARVAGNHFRLEAGGEGDR